MFPLREDNMKNKIISMMKKREPAEYAEWCVEAGQKAEALRYYQKAGGDENLYKAAELAISLKRYGLARQLIVKIGQMVDESVEWSRADAHQCAMDPEGRGMMGSAMGYASAMDRQSKMKNKLAGLEARMWGAK